MAIHLINKKSSAFLSLFFAALLMTGYQNEMQASLAAQFEVPKLSLSAQATIRKPADELQMRIGVVTIEDTAEDALKENSIRMQAVMSSLKDAELAQGEYETGHFSITPRYTPYPKDAPPNWKQTINGYEVSNSIQIHTSNSDAAGKLIDAANKAGANSIDNIHFTLKNARIYWDEAVGMATEHAINDATSVAKAAGIKLVRILNISLDNSGAINPRSNPLYFAKGMSDSAPPIEAGEVSITANVSITYEIVNR